jgi:hypothetical protein
MTSAAPYDTAAVVYDDPAYSQLLWDSQPLQEGDTVRCGDNPDDCRVIGTWSDWLWLHSLHPCNLAPFTARAGACKLMRRGEPPRWPFR